MNIVLNYSVVIIYEDLRQQHHCHMTYEDQSLVFGDMNAERKKERTATSAHFDPTLIFIQLSINIFTFHVHVCDSWLYGTLRLRSSLQLIDTAQS